MKTVLFILATILSVSFAALNPAICAAPGPVCVSCSQLATCILGEDGYNILHLQTCGVHENCFPTGCSTAPGPDCEHYPMEFQCHDIGMFPDPFDCRRYHFCVPSDGKILKYSDTCDNGYGYDVGTNFCSNKLVDDVCPEELPVPMCERPGQTGPLSNPSMYYICGQYSESIRTLYPMLFVCPFGGSYDSFVCREASEYNIRSILSRNKLLQ